MVKQKEITLSTEYIRNLYERSNEVEQALLTRMFGRGLFNPDKIIMERIKTFNDAYEEIGNNHYFVLEYEELRTKIQHETMGNLLFTKLKIIARALNGQCDLSVPNNKRYVPTFKVLSSDINPDHIEKGKAYIRRNGVYFMFNSVVEKKNTIDLNSSAYTSFRTRELAEYAGKQFISFYADLIL